MERNWSGNIEYSAARIERPTTLEELRAIVRHSRQVHIVGTRHSFNQMVDADVLISLDALDSEVEVDSAGHAVEVNPATTYGVLAPVLDHHGLGLHNLASLPHISIGGAIATSTHGSGDTLGSLATAVSALEIMRSDGELVRVERGDPDFDGAVVGMGALGAVVRVRLDVEPQFDVAQYVFEGLSWEALAANFDAITGSGYSVSMFTDWRDAVDQLWIKQRLPSAPPDGFGARPADADVHPILGVSAENCTPQRGVAGSWSNRLPHFKMGFTPSRGDELQSEVLLPRDTAIAAIDVLRDLGDDLAPQLLVSEIRTVAADHLWMSPQFGRDTVAIHFTWRLDPVKVNPLVTRVEDALAPFRPRPHWGKVFTVGPVTLAERYPRFADFVDLVGRYDARGAFRNRWLDQQLSA